MNKIYSFLKLLVFVTYKVTITYSALYGALSGLANVSCIWSRPGQNVQIQSCSSALGDISCQSTCKGGLREQDCSLPPFFISVLFNIYILTVFVMFIILLSTITSFKYSIFFRWASQLSLFKDNDTEGYFRFCNDLTGKPTKIPKGGEIYRMSNTFELFPLCGRNVFFLGGKYFIDLSVRGKVYCCWGMEHLCIDFIPDINTQNLLGYLSILSQDLEKLCVNDDADHHLTIPEIVKLCAEGSFVNLQIAQHDSYALGGRHLFIIKAMDHIKDYNLKRILILHNKEFFSETCGHDSALLTALSYSLNKYGNNLGINITKWRKYISDFRIIMDSFGIEVLRAAYLKPSKTCVSILDGYKSGNISFDKKDLSQAEDPVFLTIRRNNDVRFIPRINMKGKFDNLGTKMPSTSGNLYYKGEKATISGINCVASNNIEVVNNEIELLKKGIEELDRPDIKEKQLSYKEILSRLPEKDLNYKYEHVRKIRKLFVRMRSPGGDKLTCEENRFWKQVPKKYFDFGDGDVEEAIENRDEAVSILKSIKKVTKSSADKALKLKASLSNLEDSLINVKRDMENSFQVLSNSEEFIIKLLNPIELAAGVLTDKNCQVMPEKIKNTIIEGTYKASLHDNSSDRCSKHRVTRKIKESLQRKRVWQNRCRNKETQVYQPFNVIKKITTSPDLGGYLGYWLAKNKNITAGKKFFSSDYAQYSGLIRSINSCLNQSKANMHSKYPNPPEVKVSEKLLRSEGQVYSNSVSVQIDVIKKLSNQLKEYESDLKSIGIYLL